MEENDTTDSGSPGGNTDIDSLPVALVGAAACGGAGAPEIINMAVHTSTERNSGMKSSPAQEAAAGDIGGVFGGGPAGVGGEGGRLMLGGKKKGRPRKYDSEGNLRASYVRSPPLAAAQPTPPSYEYASGAKRGRAKPSGPGNWQALASLGELFASTACGDFTPHVITAYTGEDVAGKILAFAQKGSRGVCVLSANGSVSNVTMCQPGSSGGLLTYEGRFEILTLTGSYTISDDGGMRSRSGGLSVSLASPDGRVIGGCLAGMLMAATPIQIVIGSFIPNGFKTPKRKQQNVPRQSPSIQFAPDTVTAAVPISQAPPESNVYPTATSRLPVQSRGEAEKDHENSASTGDCSDWENCGPSYSHQRSYSDINISTEHYS